MTIQQTPTGFLDIDMTMMANRTQVRHAMLVDAYRHVIADSTVMLLWAGDGRWCYTLAAAGALQVVGIERSADMVNRFLALPDVGLRERIDLRHADPVEEMMAEARAGRQYDVIVLFDALDGVTDLHGFFGLIAQLEPRLVIGDGLFGTSEDPVLAMEPLRKPAAGLHRPTLVPSRGAIAMATYDLCFDLEWIDWSTLPDDARAGLSDYYQHGSKCRASFTMTPEELD